MNQDIRSDERAPGALFESYTRLTSGDLELYYSDGEIRHLRAGPVRVINAIYTAVRDRNWGTLEADTESELVDQKKNGFQIKTILNFRDGSELFKARITIEARQNHLTYQMEGIALSGFNKNRIGICILHPVSECRGKSIKVIHTDGSSTLGLFPEEISAVQPFKNISGIQCYPSGSIRTRLNLKGDIFEMEDQRNWTDHSYKIYSTPLEDPFPVYIEKGTKILQSMDMDVESTGPLPVKKQEGQGALKIDPSITLPLPAIGISRKPGDKGISTIEAGMLEKIGFGHYRADLYLSDDRWKETFGSVVEEHRVLGWPLELALHFGTDPGGELEAFLGCYRDSSVPLRQILLYDQGHLSDEEMLATVVPRLRDPFPGIPIGGGTDAYFAELNRNPPAREWLDFVTFTICPQVHASDTPTLIENIGTQEDVVRNAENLTGLPVSVPAVTLKQRFNVVATDQNRTGPPFPEYDARQNTPFTAAWTLGSLKQLGLAGARSITYFESVGPGGIIGLETPAGQPVEKENILHPYPVYHIFRTILEKGPLEIIATTSSDPLLFEGLLLQSEKQQYLFLANFTDTVQEVMIPGDPWRTDKGFELTPAGWKRLLSLNAGSDSISLEGNGVIQLIFDRT